MLIDEIGFHHATSVAELLADRGCAVEVVTPGMVVGQDLGITLDMEQWWIRAGAKGIVQTTDLVPMGFDGTHADAAAPPDRRQRRCARPDWVVLAVPAAPDEQLYLDLKAAGALGRAGRRLRRPAPRPRRRRRGRSRRRERPLRPATQAATPLAALARDGTGGRQAVVYQVYVRSFADADGDGIGRPRRVCGRGSTTSPRSASTPSGCARSYPSPQRDHGYDVADYFDIDPGVRRPDGVRRARRRRPSTAAYAC